MRESAVRRDFVRIPVPVNRRKASSFDTRLTMMKRHETSTENQKRACPTPIVDEKNVLSAMKSVKHNAKLANGYLCMMRNLGNEMCYNMLEKRNHTSPSFLSRYHPHPIETSLKEQLAGLNEKSPVSLRTLPPVSHWCQVEKWSGTQQCSNRVVSESCICSVSTKS